MSVDLVVEIILGLLAAALTFITFLGATRANKAQSKAQEQSVDAAAYLRAKEIYEGALSTLREEVESMRLELTKLRESDDKMRRSNAELRLEVFRLRQEIATLQGDTPPSSAMS